MAMDILKQRYFLPNENPEQMFMRVAKYVANGNSELEKLFFTSMSDLILLPNSPTLMNAGTDNPMLSACFVLPVPDSTPEIFDAVKFGALIQKMGGGTGYSFSQLRPRGWKVKSTLGIASGVVSFMKVFDAMTDTIKQGGKRRGANIGTLSIHHPDIIEFIMTKTAGLLQNFNLSVAITDEFMEACKNNKNYNLYNPKNGAKYEELEANKIMDLIAKTCYDCGDPGLLFMDEINRRHTILNEKIQTTNPCGETPLLDNESCNLGSIDITKFYSESKFDWEMFSQIIGHGVKFLDNVIDVNKFPLPQIEEKTKQNRKIGLGVMGFAHLLFKMGIRYGSEDSLKLADKLSMFLYECAKQKSVELGQELGSFPNKANSIYKHPIRNATLIAIAPTGTLSILANCSSSIEPVFQLSYQRIAMDQKYFVIDPVFEQMLISLDYDPQFTCQQMKTNKCLPEGLPEEWYKTLVTAKDIPPEQHVKMLATWQRNTDNAVSKTVNLPNSATPEDIKKIYLMAYDMKVKGITVYRDGSKTGQVLS